MRHHPTEAFIIEIRHLPRCLVLVVVELGDAQDLPRSALGQAKGRQG
jgi:hypothetical protein